MIQRELSKKNWACTVFLEKETESFWLGRRTKYEIVKSGDRTATWSGENDSINIEKGGESCQRTCRKGRKKWREKKGREEKRTPCFNPAWFPLALSLYGTAACVYVSVCVCVCVCDTGSVPVLLWEGAIRSANACWLQSKWRFLS